MEVTENQTELRQDYQLWFFGQVQELTQKRKNLRVSQLEVSRIAKCSPRKIQLFENYKSLDNYLIFVYSKLEQ